MEENQFNQEAEEKALTYESNNEGNTKRKGRIPVAVAAVITAAAMVIGGCLGCFGTLMVMKHSGYNELGLSRENWEKLKWGMRVVDSTYNGKIDEKELTDGMLMGMSIALDEYSIYMPKKSAEEFLKSVDGDEEYSGLGLYLQNDTASNTIKVMTALNHSPAQAAGLKTGDIISAVDGTVVTGDDLDKASEMMKGKEGTSVKLTVIKGDTGLTEEIEIVREKIKMQTVYTKMADEKIGYIQITQFGANTQTEFIEGYNGLCDEGMEKLIIDLRDNPGGYLEIATGIADIFLPEGKLIVYTQNKNGEKVEYKAKATEHKIETVILANGGTASASEVLIGALCDNGKATLVGTKTYGKGVTQAMVPHEDGSVFKVTDSKYYTPKGVCIDKKGINPDIEVQYSGVGDSQLDAAIEALK